MSSSLERVSRVPAVLLKADTKVELIRHLPLFELCSKRDLRRIAALAVEREIDEGGELIREGEPGTEFFVVVDGEIDVRRRRDRAALALAPDRDGRRDDAAPRARDRGAGLRRVARLDPRALAQGRPDACRPGRRGRGGRGGLAARPPVTARAARASSGRAASAAEP